MQPYRCPICGGTGDVPAGFYGPASLTDTAAEPCRSCQATGIVWGGDEPSPTRVERLPDGAVRITLPVQDEESSADLARWVCEELARLGRRQRLIDVSTWGERPHSRTVLGAIDDD